MEKYNPNMIENKWQRYWKENNINEIELEKKKQKYYCLDMFPYPSGSGLHVGHWLGYVLSDIYSRQKKLQDYNVLHPMGWDAFGLPAENDAIKKEIHPRISIQNNIENFKRQLKDIGAMYNWSHEINTSEPEYYHWTQLIFLKMYKKGLAYRKKMPINWCPDCKTGLANEEVIGGRCERCDTLITKKLKEHWMLKITAYADRLVDELEELNWPDKVKKMQREWIGRSRGVKIEFPTVESNETIKVFTTRPDTLYGVSYLVLAPEHSSVEKITVSKYKEKVSSYVEKSMRRSNIERKAQGKNKGGVFTGSYAVNPISCEMIPIWIADYVLTDYGTGAIMAVPAHDQRDLDFARRHNLPIKKVITKNDAEKTNNAEAYTGKGVLINSGPFSGLNSHKGGKDITQRLIKKGLAKETVSYRLRDWVFSRQRYWGEPIPIIYCKKCGELPLPEDKLPLTLPHVEKYKPTGTGESPLAGLEEWVNTTCHRCGGPAERETDTMPQWAGSSWYFIRYADPVNKKIPFDKAKADYWLPVDLYVGGIEHAVLHLLYARFFTKFLYDSGWINFDEPFKKLFNQGMIYKDGSKMSKSKPNAVNPDPLVKKYGADSLRLYEMFIGPPEQDSEWNDSGLNGIHRFLKRVWNLALLSLKNEPEKKTETTRATHRLIKKTEERTEEFKLNTVVSEFMSYLNKIEKQNPEGIDKENLKTFITLLAPFTPHIAEEIWNRMGISKSIFKSASWPEYNPELITKSILEIPVQINGRVRASVKIEKGLSKEEVIQKAESLNSIKDHLKGKQIVKRIFVPDRILNFVVK